MKKRKVGICAHFGQQETFLDGQTIKTRELADVLRRIYGDDEIRTADTYLLKKNPFRFGISCIRIMTGCKNVIILPAHNGVRKFVPLFLCFRKLFGFRFHYVVIGGWLPKLLGQVQRLKKKVAKVDRVYVETSAMKRALESLGLNNVLVMPNFKDLRVLSEKELVYPRRPPYPLCTFSRVLREKGIEEAAIAVRRANETLKKTMFTLEIYGQIDQNYAERFELKRKEFPDYIAYRGTAAPSTSTEILKDKFALLFPTQFQTEGLAGTILDAFSAGIPVIATDVESNREIIHDREDGLLYDGRDPDALYRILLRAAEAPDLLNNMKAASRRRAYAYTPRRAVTVLLENLK